MLGKVERGGYDHLVVLSVWERETRGVSFIDLAFVFILLFICTLGRILRVILISINLAFACFPAFACQFVVGHLLWTR